MSRNDQRVVQAWSNPSCTQQIWHRHTAELGQGANSTCSKSVILSLTLMVETWMRGGPPKETCNWNLRPCHGEVRCVYSISIYIYRYAYVVVYVTTHQTQKRKVSFPTIPLAAFTPKFWPSGFMIQNKDAQETDLTPPASYGWVVQQMSSKSVGAILTPWLSKTTKWGASTIDLFCTANTLQSRPRNILQLSESPRDRDLHVQVSPCQFGENHGGKASIT